MRCFGSSTYPHVISYFSLRCLNRLLCSAAKAANLSASVIFAPGGAQENSHNLKRKDVSNLLDISMDTLRNWEMNGLLTVKRKNNGYRVYTDEDIQRLKIIRSLRCANYSLEAIRRLLQQLSKNPNIDIRVALNTPKQTEDIISVCDRLIISLSDAETNAKFLLEMLQEMKILFS